jgi:hypothetical protein
MEVEMETTTNEKSTVWRRIAIVTLLLVVLVGPNSARFRTCLGRAYRLKAPSLAFSFGFVLLF